MASLSVRDYTVGEGDGFVDVTVRLSEALANSVTVGYATANWTTDYTYDYVGQTGTLTFNPGETTKVVRIELEDAGQVNSNSYQEAIERFKFVLSSPTNATLESPGFSWITIVDNDTVVDTPELYMRDIVVDEAAGTANFIVQLGRLYGQSSAGTVSVDYSTANGSASAGSDYTATSGTLTFLPGESVKTVSVPLSNDTTAEAAETFSLVLSNPSSATLFRGTAQATIGANDATPASQPKIAVTDQTVGEGNGFIDVTVSLSAPSASKVTVGYDTANWTTDYTYDYVGQTGTLTFNPGETTKVVRIELLDVGQYNNNSEQEEIDRLKFVLSSPTNATLESPGFSWITIVDNDTVVDTPELYMRDIVVDEAAGTANFIVQLGRLYGQSSAGTVSVDYSTANGSASAGSDYTATSGTLTFLPGESVKTVSVPLSNDTTAEAAETFSLVLSNPSSATLFRGTAQATIGANDATPASQPKIAVTDQTVGEGNGFIDVTVSLSAPSASKVTVGYDTTNWTTDYTYDYVGQTGTLTFNPGETTKVVRIELDDAGQVNSNSYQEEIERFKFVLSSPTNATLESPGFSWITIVDNDTVVDTPELYMRDIVVDEAAGTANFIVQLGRLYGQSSNGTVSVDYSTANGSASAGSDYTATSGTLTFLPGESVKTVSVPLSNDTTAEAAETFSLVLSNPSSATLFRGTAQATIGANDATPASQPKIAVTDQTVGEGNGFIDVTVSLSAPSASKVTVGYDTTNWTTDYTYDYVGQTGTLTFNPGETTKVVRIELDDAGQVNSNSYQEEIERFKFVLSSPTNATLESPGFSWITIVDNDTVVDTPELYMRDIVVDEAAGTANFIVQLGRLYGQSSNGTVSVDYSTANGSASAGSDFTATSGTLTFLPGESVKTVSVPLSNDTSSEGVETFDLLLSNELTSMVVRGAATAYIGASDGVAAAQPSILTSDIMVGESDTFAEVVVRLTAPSANKVTVAYATANGTTGYYDYIEQSGTLTFNPGETTQVVRIELVDNTSVEAIENFKLQLSSPSGANLATPNYAWIHIVDDDTVSENPPVYISDVTVDELAGWADVSVRLGDVNGARSASTVTVDFATSNISAAAGSDYLARSGTLSFLPGETARTIRVPIIADAAGEALETFRVTLSNAINAEIVDTEATVTILANAGVALPTYALQATAASFNEGGNATFTLATTNVANGTVLNYTIGGTVSAADITGGALAGSVTVNGNSATISVPLAADALTEGTESISLSITGTTASASANVADTSTSPPVVVYSVPGTPGIDYVVPSAGDRYFGGAGNDVFIINSVTLNRPVTATIGDTEGSNVVQLVDGLVIASSWFLANAMQLTLSSGAIVQVLGASSYSYQIGANLIAGDGASILSWAQFVAALGGSVPSGSSSSTGTPNFAVPAGFSPATPIAPVAAGPSYTVSGTLGNDNIVVAAGNRYFGGGGDDTYIVGGNSFSGSVTASLSDTEGSNVIQLVDGTTIATSLFLSDALQLTLSTGSTVQVLGASRYAFQVGANVTAGDSAASLSYADFAALLGTTLPAAGAPGVSGTPNYLVPTGSSTVAEGTHIGFADGASPQPSLAGIWDPGLQLLLGSSAD